MHLPGVLLTSSMLHHIGSLCNGFSDNHKMPFGLEYDKSDFFWVRLRHYLIFRKIGWNRWTISPPPTFFLIYQLNTKMVQSCNLDFHFSSMGILLTLGLKWTWNILYCSLSNCDVDSWTGWYRDRHFIDTLALSQIYNVCLLYKCNKILLYKLQFSIFLCSLFKEVKISLVQRVTVFT